MACCPPRTANVHLLIWRALDYTNKEGLCLKEIALIKKKKIKLSHLRHTKSGRLLSDMRCPPFILFQALTVYRFQDWSSFASYSTGIKHNFWPWVPFNTYDVSEWTLLFPLALGAEPHLHYLGAEWDICAFSCLWCVSPPPIGSSAVSATQRVVPPRVTSEYEFRDRGSGRKEQCVLYTRTYLYYRWYSTI